MATSLLALLDDIASVLDDVAVLTKAATQKTAGVLGDDLALNAQQVAGVRADRELPVVWAVAKGSLLNKTILVPAALAISALAPWAVLPLLMIGGVYLCYEGFEKLVHKLPHGRQNGERHDAAPLDLAAAEKTRIKGAVRTDFVLSAEIIVIALGTVAGKPFPVRAAVLVGIALLMTVGVYGLVAGIVKLDDAGLYLSRREGRAAAARIQRSTGVSILRAAPYLMKALGIAGTAAMFLVGGASSSTAFQRCTHGAQGHRSRRPCCSMSSWASWPARWSWRSCAARSARSAARDDHADRIETVVVGIVQSEARRRRFAERGAPRPVVGGQSIAQARAPVALEDDTLDVVARGVGQRRPALQHVGAEPLDGEPGRAERPERALTTLLEGELATLVTAPFHLGLAQATLEGGMTGQEHRVQELRLFHDDPAARANDTGELAERPARVLDVVEHIAAPDPVEARVGRVELRGVAFPKFQSRGGRPVGDERTRRLDALPRRLDPDDASPWADRLGEPEGEEPDATPDVETAGTLGQAEVGDERARFGLLEEIHALERLREGLGLGLTHARACFTRSDVNGSARSRLPVAFATALAMAAAAGPCAPSPTPRNRSPS